MSTTTLYKDANTTLTLPGQILISIQRQAAEINPVNGDYPSVTDPNRVVETYTVTNCVLSLSDWETLLTWMRTAQSSYASGYPKLRVYNKSASPYYNTFQVWFHPNGVQNARLISSADSSSGGKIMFNISFVRTDST